MSNVEGMRVLAPAADALTEGAQLTGSPAAKTVADHHRSRALALLSAARRIGAQLSNQKAPPSFDANAIDQAQGLSEQLSYVIARAKLHADLGASETHAITGALEGWTACQDGSFTLPCEAPSAPAGFLRLELRVIRVSDGVPHWGWCVGSDPMRARGRSITFGAGPGDQLGDTEYDVAWRAALDALVAAQCWRASVGPGDY